jgi:hypothetical protein
MKDPELSKLTNEFLKSVQQTNALWAEMHRRGVYVQARITANQTPSSYSGQCGIEVYSIVEPVDYLTNTTKAELEKTNG